MPVAKGTVTREIVENIDSMVDAYNRCNERYVRCYNRFMRNRDRILALHDGIFTNMLNDLSFTKKLHKILVDFGLNARASILMSSKKILDSVRCYGSEFDLISSANVSLPSLNLLKRLEKQTINSIVRKIFRFFAKPNKITKAGGLISSNSDLNLLKPTLAQALSNLSKKSLSFLVCDTKILGDMTIIICLKD